MLVAIYARHLGELEINTLKKLIAACIQEQVDFIFHKSLAEGVKEHFQEFDITDKHFYNRKDDLRRKKVQFFVCIGGDGTMLDSILFVGGTNVPVLGINTGRLGYLSTIALNEIEAMLVELKAKNYDIDPRSALESRMTTLKNPKSHFALNDISLHKRDTSSMITIHTYLNGEYFNTYWADGLLVSTPTGSTAYSLSCGGPIMYPDAQGFIITPVAPHNLNVRPIIVSDQTTITLKVDGRGVNYLLAMDSRNRVVDYDSIIEIKKAPFSLDLVSFKSKSFSKTLQDKLNWGRDNRNLV